MKGFKRLIISLSLENLLTQSWHFVVITSKFGISVIIIVTKNCCSNVLQIKAKDYFKVKFKLLKQLLYWEHTIIKTDIWHKIWATKVPCESILDASKSKNMRKVQH